MITALTMLIAFAIREYTHFLHDNRRDKLIEQLTDKIKARDFTEYKTMTEDAPVYDPVDRDDESLYRQELEEMKQ